MNYEMKLNYWSSLVYSSNLPAWKNCDMLHGGGDYVYYSGHDDTYDYHGQH
jgi:hypothetical protein